MLVGITGGIGAGKSVVSRILTTMGYWVYDTDSRAKVIMDTSETIKAELVHRFGSNVVRDGRIDRSALGEIVFNDNDKLDALNRMVHHAVISDVCRCHESVQGLMFVESAILFSSGLYRHVDAVWQVIAPRQLRIERAMRRSSLTAALVEARIAAQQEEQPRASRSEVFSITNDGRTPLLPQILHGLARIK